MNAYILFIFLLLTNCLVAQKKSFTLNTTIGTAVLLNAQTAKNPGIGFGLHYSQMQSKKIINWLGIQYAVLQKRPDEETYVAPFYYPKTYYTTKNLFLFFGKIKSITKKSNLGLALTLGYYTGSETLSNLALVEPGDAVFKDQKKASKIYSGGLLATYEYQFSKKSAISVQVTPQIKLFRDKNKSNALFQTSPNSSMIHLGVNYIHSFHFI